MIPTTGGALNTGLSTLLNGDATLMTLAPGKAWQSEAPGGEQRITVIWNVPPALDRHTFQGGGFVEAVVLVKAMKIGSDDTGLPEAYARVHALMDGLTVPGLTVAGVLRINEVGYAEERNPFKAWHAGGEYRVWLEASA